MTADPVTFALHPSSPRSISDTHAEHRVLPLPADTRGSGPRRPHPGDILYWVACVGGACLLLIAATT